MPLRDPRVDAYIANAAPFARPVLKHFRALVRAAVPDIEETMKWSMPFYVRGGKNVCSMAAFKEHCAIGFWHHAMQDIIAKEQGTTTEGMGHFGRITSRDELPNDRVLTDYILAAVDLVDRDEPSRPRGSKPRPELPVPADLAKALRKDAKAAAAFKAFSPSHRREYIEWISEAKRPETRIKRVQTTLEWLRQGKSRNWKYA